MRPILQIKQINSNDENTLSFRITVTDRAEIINSEDELVSELEESYPYKKGILAITRLSNNIWDIKTNK